MTGRAAVGGALVAAFLLTGCALETTSPPPPARRAETPAPAPGQKSVDPARVERLKKAMIPLLQVMDKPRSPSQVKVGIMDDPQINDLAALPIGSYTPREIARPVHISPEEAVQAGLDLRATHLLGVHWGTFALAREPREPYDEPPQRLAAEVARRHLDPASTWVLEPGETRAW